MTTSRRDIPLSTQLRRATRDERRSVDGYRLARAFARGALSVETYAEGLARLYPVYATMESAFASARRDDRLRAFALPAARRSAAILADLRHFGVPAEPIRAGASARYFARVRLVADETPVQLVAYAYAHYFADVSGALTAGRVARLGVSLSTRGGSAFVSFPEILCRDGFRADFLRRLDAFPMSELERRAVLDETKLVFELHRGVAAELWSPASDVVLRRDRTAEPWPACRGRAVVEAAFAARG